MHQAARTAASVRSPLYDAARVDQGIDRCRLILALVRLLLLMFRFFFRHCLPSPPLLEEKRNKRKQKNCSQAPGSVSPQPFNIRFYVLSITQVRRHFLTFFKQSSPSVCFVLFCFFRFFQSHFFLSGGWSFLSLLKLTFFHCSRLRLRRRRGGQTCVFERKKKKQMRMSFSSFLSKKKKMETEML